MNTWRYLLFGCGQFGMMALARFFFMWIIKYPDATSGTVPGMKIPVFEGLKIPMPLAESVGDPLAALFGLVSTVGLVFLGFRIFDGVTDPIAGMLSDAWVKRGKERRILLWFSFAFPPLGLAMVFWPDGSLSPTLRWLLMGGGMFVFFVGYTFYAIPYWSLLDDYTHGDKGQRRIMSNVLGAGLLAATLTGFVISGDLIETYGYRTAALWFAVPSMLLMVLPFFARPPGDAPSPTLEPEEEKVGAFEGFLLAFKHRRFLAVLVIFSGSQMAFSVMTGAAPVIVARLLGGSESDLKYVMGPFLLTALPCFVIVPILSKRFGWQKTVAMASIALGVVYAGTAFLGDPIIHSEIVTAGVLFGLGGPMAAVLLGLEGEAVTACADEAGGKVTSVYFGVFNFVVKGMNGVAVYLTTYLSARSIQSDLGDTAVRAMGIMAGCMLAVGVGLYFMIRPKEALPTPETEGALDAKAG